jgi:DNA mismatch repair protein MutL
MDLGQRVRRLFGRDLADALVPVDASDGTTRLKGLVAPPRLSRGDTSRQMWFLNGRPLRDKLLVSVLRQAHHGFQVERRHPVAFLLLSVDPHSVDVNVHPMKSEVRFREQRRLFGFLVGALREAVARTDMATPGEHMLQRVERRGEWKPAQLPDPGKLEMTPRPFVSAERGRERITPYELSTPDTEGSPDAVSQEVIAGPPGLAEVLPDQGGWGETDDLRGPFLQVAKTYLIRSLPDGFEIVDQHALHERLTFEGLKKQVAESRIEVQRYLVPQLVELSRSEVTLLGEHLEALAAIGIELEVFGETTVAVQGLPALMRRPDSDEIVRDAVRLCNRGGPPPDAGDFLDDLLHNMACRSSIMAGDELGQEEIHALLQSATEVAHDQTCPHGRPTRVRFRLSDLEKAFHRK